MQAHPKSFDLLKIRAKSVKIYGNVRKISENLGKLRKNTGKTGAQRCLNLKNWRLTCRESYDLCWRSSQKKVFMVCVGRNIRTKSCPKTRKISGKFGEIRAKIFCTPQNLPAPTPVTSVTGSSRTKFLSAPLPTSKMFCVYS